MLPILRSTLSEHDELRPIKHLYISIAYDHEDLLLIRTYFEAQDHIHWYNVKKFVYVLQRL